MAAVLRWMVPIMPISASASAGSLQPFAVAACGEVCEAGLSVEDYIRNKTGRDIYMHTGGKALRRSEG